MIACFLELNDFQKAILLSGFLMTCLKHRLEDMSENIQQIYNTISCCFWGIFWESTIA